ncbi:MAG: DUF937 domain-containing protein [Vicinamibacterales bacterium]
MNIMDLVLNAQNGSAALAAGQQVGLSADQTTAALSALVPPLTAGLQRNATQPGGLDALVSALAKGGHAQYVDDLAAIRRPETVADGNAILGHILGNKEASRAVAAQAAAQTGLSADVLKKLLPIVATMVMGSLAKKRSAPAGAGAGDLLSMLTPMLDQNRDGSVVDDIVGKLGGILGKR